MTSLSVMRFGRKDRTTQSNQHRQRQLSRCHSKASILGYLHPEKKKSKLLTSVLGSAPGISSMLAFCFVTTGKSTRLRAPSATGRLFLSTLDSRVWTVTIGVCLSESYGPVIGIRASSGLATRRLSCGITSSAMTSIEPFSVMSVPSHLPTISSPRSIKPLCTLARSPGPALTLGATSPLDRRVHDTHVTTMHNSPVACDKCGEVVANSRELVDHKNREHSGPREKYVCSVPGCGFRTARPASMEVHMESHSNEKNWPCTIDG